MQAEGRMPVANSPEHWPASALLPWHRERILYTVRQEANNGWYYATIKTKEGDVLADGATEEDLQNGVEVCAEVLGIGDACFQQEGRPFSSGPHPHS